MTLFMVWFIIFGNDFGFVTDYGVGFALIGGVFAATIDDYFDDFDS